MHFLGNECFTSHTFFLVRLFNFWLRFSGEAFTFSFFMNFRGAFFSFGAIFVFEPFFTIHY
jgi:hypothetical protein